MRNILPHSNPAASLSPAAGPYSYEHEGDRQFATTLARGLEVLRCFTPLEPMLGNKEIPVRTGLPKPTVSRLDEHTPDRAPVHEGTRRLHQRLGEHGNPRPGLLRLGPRLVAMVRNIEAALGIH